MKPYVHTMAEYTATHLETGQEFLRPYFLQNPLRRDRVWQQPEASAAEAYHQSLPFYNQTQLHDLPSLAAELGLAHVFVKTNRIASACQLSKSSVLLGLYT